MGRSFVRYVAVVTLAGAAGAACEVEQTEEGSLPDVDVAVDAEPGTLPEYQVDWAKVDVGTRTETIEVPKTVVIMEEEQVQVPYVDINMPNGGTKEERSITAEIEVEGQGHELEIQEIYGTGERLIVVSRLTATGEPLGDDTMRVSDRVIVSAPELDVRHFVIGERPKGEWNRQYTFVPDRAALDARLEGATRIYTRAG